MHLDGLDFSGDVHGAEGGDHLGLDDTGLDSTDGNCTDTGNLVDILEGESERLIGGSLGGVEIVQGVEEDGSLVPGHVLGSVDHVITDPSGNGNELNLGGVVSDLLEVDGELGLDFVVSLLGVLGETGFELTFAGGDHEDGGISLRGTSDHVLDEISVSRGINDSVGSLGGLEFPESDINGDTTLTLGLQLIE